MDLPTFLGTAVVVVTLTGCFVVSFAMLYDAIQTARGRRWR